MSLGRPEPLQQSLAQLARKESLVVLEASVLLEQLERKEKPGQLVRRGRRSLGLLAHKVT